jgi:hypothetical protein
LAPDAEGSPAPEPSLVGQFTDFAKEAMRRQARRDAGLPLHETPEELAKVKREADDRLEREIQAECVREYRANGFIVYEGIKSKARITPGQPDLTLFHPRTKWHGYHEVKTPLGELRPDQKDFRETCIATDVPHFYGGMETCRFIIAFVTEKK